MNVTVILIIFMNSNVGRNIHLVMYIQAITYCKHYKLCDINILSPDRPHEGYIECQFGNGTKVLQCTIHQRKACCYF